MAAAQSENAEFSNAYATFTARQALDQRVQDIGWRLVTANAPYCAGAAASIGLQLHDMANYADPDGVRMLLDLRGDFAVLTIAKGSPAEVAGLKPNTEIAMIDGQALSDWPADARNDWRRAKRVHDAIDHGLAQSGSVKVSRRSDDEFSIAGVMACPSRFELGGKGESAFAEGTRVIIERDFPGFGYAEDELAAAIAHELAHNLLAHPGWLDEHGRRLRNIRLTEREADRLMPWLLANAGYAPEAALRFMKKWGPKHSGGIFRKRSHEGWDERAEIIAGEIEALQQVIDQEGAADWSRFFVRDTGVTSSDD